MITWWNKRHEPKLVHELHETETRRMHPAEHDPCSPRLLGVLRVRDRYYWNSCCLSDFIRARKSLLFEPW
jgi:hypothetical protein